jgi:hypothetical protein
LHDPGRELKGDTKKEDPKEIQESSVDHLAENESRAGDREAIKNVAEGPDAAERARPELLELATIEN